METLINASTKKPSVYEEKTKRNPLKNQEIPFQCFGRESNPYGHFWPRDFKSRVSTYSTTKANRIAKIVIFCEYEIEIPNQVWNAGDSLE